MMAFIRKIKSIIPYSVWEYFRLRSILKSHKAVAQYWDNILDKYSNGEIEKFSLKPKKNIDNSEKIIWQYWGQGFSSDVVPDVVQMCFDSIDKYKGDYTVIRLCDDDLNEYIEFPDDVMNKYRTGVMGAAHFSDILRLALIATYGGVWLDATMLLTGALDNMLTQNDWFMYQRDPNQEDKKLWRRTYAYYFGWHKDFKVRLLNSIIYSMKKSVVVSDFYNLLVHYWRTQNKIIDYFFFQILFTQYMEKYPERNCTIVSDCLPNLLQMYITGSYRKYSVPEIFDKVSIHKLSYKTMTVDDLKNIIDHIEC